MSQTCYNCLGSGKVGGFNSRTGELGYHAECDICKGTGSLKIRRSATNPWRRCVTCGGRGKGTRTVVVGHYPSGKEKTAQQEVVCETCKGKGAYYIELGRDIRDLEPDL